MDRELILEKLEALRRCIRRVESKRPADAAALAADWDLQDIITLNLTRAGLDGRRVRAPGQYGGTERRGRRENEKGRWFSKCPRP